MIGQPGGHCGSLPVRAENTTKIKMGNLQSQRKAVIPQDFAVPERFPGKSAVEKAHIEILPFHVVYGNFGPVWFAQYRNALNVLQPYRPFPPWSPGA